MALLAGCTSDATKAAQQASEATAAFTLGRYPQARTAIDAAIALRDDVPEYWSLDAQIALAQGDYTHAMRSYHNVLSLDRTNLEAMTRLCQLALATGQVDDDINGYADQLLVLNGEDPAALLAKGGFAMANGGLGAAIGYADRVLKTDPANLGATILKARALTAKQQFAEASALLERSLVDNPAGPGSRLRALAELYRRRADRPNYVATVKRLAAANPDDATIQLRYADLAYQDGDGAAAREAVVTVMRKHGTDLGSAHDVRDLLLLQGAGAFDPGSLPGVANGLTTPMRAALARYAVALRRPDIATAVLGPTLAAAPPSGLNLDGKVVLAMIAAQRGQPARARALVAQVLATDAAQPAALLVRARLEIAAGNLDAAITDARRVLSDDGGNAEAALLLADALTADKEPDLATGAVRQAFAAAPADVTLGARLARMRLAAGDRDEAGTVLRGLLNAAPVDARVQRLRQALCPTVGPACGTAANPVPGTIG